MASSFEAAIYIKTVPEFTLDDGLVHICHKTGRARFELVMRPNTFFRTIRAASILAKRMEAEKATVTPIRSDAAH